MNGERLNSEWIDRLIIETGRNRPASTCQKAYMAKFGPATAKRRELQNESSRHLFRFSDFPGLSAGGFLADRQIVGQFMRSS
jgi:hypothetical protein